jgi:hypothetical protein
MDTSKTLTIIKHGGAARFIKQAGFSEALDVIPSIGTW